MYEITFHPSFKKKYKKIIKENPYLHDIFWKKIEIFTDNPFDPRLKTHKLTGKLQDSFSISIDYDLRVLFYFYEKNKTVFINIGSHDEIY